MTDERWFPIISTFARKDTRPFPTRIRWSTAELAYSLYSAQHGNDQSLERMAERGGFHPDEMDEFVPDWREREDELTALRAQQSQPVAPPGADLPQSEGPLCTIHPDQRTPCAMCLRAGIGTCPKCGKPSPAVDAYCSTCEKVVLRHVVPAVPGADLRAALQKLIEKFRHNYGWDNSARSAYLQASDEVAALLDAPKEPK